MARPTKLNQQSHDKICQALRAGNNRPASAAYGGVTYQTFLNWLKRGRESLDQLQLPETIEDSEIAYAKFFEGVQKAEGHAEVGAVAIIQKAAREGISGQWQAAAWWLERKFPDKWGRRERIEKRDPIGEKIQINVSGPATVERDAD